MVEEKKRMVLVAWKKVCLPPLKGGLSIQNLKKMNVALMCKVAWKIAKGVDSPWVEAVHAKYLPNSPFLEDLNQARFDLLEWHSVYQGVYL